MVNDGYYGYINYSEGDVAFYGREIINDGWVRLVVVMVTVNDMHMIRHQLLEKKCYSA